MPVLDTEIIWRPSLLVSDATPAQNGGRMRFTQSVSGVKNNLFPDVSQAERTAGATKWRKAFIHINNAADLALQNVRLFLDSATPGGDFVTFHAGTQSDTQDTVTARGYGVGILAAPITAGATQIQVAGENPTQYATLQPFRVGDVIRIADRAIDALTGNEEFATISAITYGAESATIDLTTAVANSYAIDGTLISSVLEIASIAASVGTVTVTSTAGTLDSATAGNLAAHNPGAVADTWTLTFTDASNYALSGTATGAVSGSGSINADYSPLNPATGTPYFTLKSTAWGGTFAAGNTVGFATTPAAAPIWYRRQVPAGTASLANDYASLAIYGESA